MSNIWRIFTSEVKLLGYNVVTVLIVLGLIFMPSLFTWYNVLACWDVFDNTGNLTVAVANCDEGYKSELLPLEINMGERVVSSLRENDQIGWVFVDEEEAIDGAASGKYYAAVVIPEGFSRAILSFDEDDDGSELVYYSNAKKNAIAPKITGQGADRISHQINQTFAETIDDIALSAAQSIGSYLESSDSTDRISALSSLATKAADRVDNVADVVSLYGGIATASQNLLSSSSDLLGEVVDAGSDLADVAKEGIDDAQDTTSSVRTALEGAVTAIEKSKESLQKISSDLSDKKAQAKEEVIACLREEKTKLDTEISAYKELLAALQDDPDSSEVAIEALRTAITKLEALSADLESTADDLESGSAFPTITAMKERIAEAVSSLETLKASFQEKLENDFDTLDDEIETLSAAFASIDLKAQDATDDLSSAIGSATSDLGTLGDKLSSAETGLRQAATKLRTLSTTVEEALATNDLESLKDLLSSDAGTLAKALSAPVSVERNAIYPSSSFGSSMFPLYSTLALFIAALLIVVLFKPTVSERVLEEFPEHAKPTQRQQFLAHFGVMSIVSLLQTTNLALGSMFFLQVQVVNPFLFLVCFWVSGLVFAFIMYALVAMFSNLGKGIGVLLLIVQVTGCGGSYPLAVLPDFVQAISPYLPAYHIVNAMRAVMFGASGNEFFIEMGIVVAFAIPILVACLVFIRPFKAFYRFYIRKALLTKLLE